MTQTADAAIHQEIGQSWATGCRQFALRVLRGIGQVTFLPRALTGTLFAAALFSAGWEYGLYGVGGAAVGTLVAALLGVEKERLTLGMEGFNACLVGVSCAVFLNPDQLSSVLVALLGCAAATVATAAAGRALGAWGLPALTLPFCLVASVITLAAPGFARVWTGGGGIAAFPRAVSGARTGLQLDDAVRGFFAGFGQIFLMPQWYAGALVLAGLLVAGPRVAGVACLGNVAGMATAWALGEPAAQLADGTSAYNAVLVALALGGVFLEATRRTVPYAVAGAVAATVCAPAFGALAAPVGGHMFTWPFALTTLVFLVAARSFPRLTQSSPCGG
ncbi:urea transporter [Streptomyces endophyticus]|uniref:Urea transporter n=1 Tax=Streptomyces endophyticus TaxID=714166 RepID=A0ABU6FAM3_9ACTN|nr:urea transporter [Streptomyces endophyticus]MEB8339901.1 urea transporter [Streptomyces endophyticus]